MSDDSDSDENDEDTEEVRDKIFAEFVGVKRTKIKFKVEFRNAFIHINGRDYVVKNLVGDLTY